MGRGEGWLEGCQGRRERGGVEVVGEGGTTSTLRPGVTQKRHFFGLCPSCLSIGEHSACSGLSTASPISLLCIRVILWRVL